MPSPLPGSRCARALALGATLLVALAALFAPQASVAKSETAQLGDVTATLTYSNMRRDSYRNFRLAIVRGGQTLFDQQLKAPCKGCPRLPAGMGADDSVKVVDLSGDGEPEVIVDLYTGGAHCCTYSYVFSYDPATNGYTQLEHDWGDVGYELKDLGSDGKTEFRSADPDFAYAFTSFAGSGFPLQIWRLQGGKLVDVTRDFPALVRKDAQSYLRAYRRGRSERGGDVRGVLAAYVADEYLLDRGAQAEELLTTALRRGDLDRQSRFDTGPFGRRYVDKLHAFLRRQGYERPVFRDSL